MVGVFVTDYYRIQISFWEVRQQPRECPIAQVENNPVPIPLNEEATARVSRSRIGGTASQNSQNSPMRILLTGLLIEVDAHFSVPFQPSCANITFSDRRASAISLPHKTLDNTGNVKCPPDAIYRRFPGRPTAAGPPMVHANAPT